MTRSGNPKTLVAWAFLALCLAGLDFAVAQTVEPNDAPAIPIEVSDAAPAGTHPSDAPLRFAESADAREPHAPFNLDETGLVPEMSAGVQAWLAIVIILLLLLRLDPLLTLHNLDALVLALTCALLLSRAGELDARAGVGLRRLVARRRLLADSRSAAVCAA